MIQNFIIKLEFLLFFLSILNCVKHGWEVFKRLKNDNPDKYTVKKHELILLGVSISYILTIIFTGFKF